MFRVGVSKMRGRMNGRDAPSGGGQRDKAALRGSVNRRIVVESDRRKQRAEEEQVKIGGRNDGQRDGTDAK